MFYELLREINVLLHVKHGPDESSVCSELYREATKAPGAARALAAKICIFCLQTLTTHFSKMVHCKDLFPPPVPWDHLRKPGNVLFGTLTFAGGLGKFTDKQDQHLCQKTHFTLSPQKAPIKGDSGPQEK